MNVAFNVATKLVYFHKKCHCQHYELRQDKLVFTLRTDGIQNAGLLKHNLSWKKA